jgi:predicted transcriptional regulator
MRVRVELDDATTRRLVRLAVRERRNVHWQAEILLRELLSAREDLAGPLSPPKEVRHERTPTSPAP